MTLKNKRNALCNMAISLMNASQRAQFKNIDCGGRETKHTISLFAVGGVSAGVASGLSSSSIQFN